MKNRVKIFIAAASLIVGLAVTGCSDWSTPKPLSEYTPETALIDYEGFKSAVNMCNRDTRYLDFYPPSLSDQPPISTEWFFSDIAVNGMTDATTPPQDLNSQITPTASMTGLNVAKCTWFWNALYKGVKDTNTIITRALEMDVMTEDQRNEILAEAYFHRAYRYYRLTHMFGDVPFIAWEPTAARYDYYTSSRESILRQMKEELDNYVQYLPERANFGELTRAAGYHMLTKINLSLGEFDDAIKSASAVIDDGIHKLMTSRFGIDEEDATKNVIWDLHRPENKSTPANTESIYNVIDVYGTPAASAVGTEAMRNAVPWLSASGWILTPDGKNAFTDNDETTNPYLLEYGRGIGTVRPSGYSQYQIWSMDNTDLRHDIPSGNWMTPEQLTYNNPALAPGKSAASPYYGVNLKKGETICNDTIRCWFEWPNYKVNVGEQRSSSWRGGNCDWYIFRLAETYLLRAEAYIWKDQQGLAAADINAIRTRAGAAPIADNEATIRMVIDERARELFYEEPRKCELTRISYLYAQTGKTSDYGTTYDMANFGTKNFFFDHISATTDFYNKGVTTLSNRTYTMSAYHVLWPVPYSEISANVEGHINQNYGYPGYETNIPPIEGPNER